MEKVAEPVREVWTLHVRCGSCKVERSSLVPLTLEQARAVMLVLALPSRGFDCVLCEPCYAAGHRQQTTTYHFVKHGMH